MTDPNMNEPQPLSAEALTPLTEEAPPDAYTTPAAKENDYKFRYLRTAYFTLFLLLLSLSRGDRITTNAVEPPSDPNPPKPTIDENEVELGDISPNSDITETTWSTTSPQDKRPFPPEDLEADNDHESILPPTPEIKFDQNFDVIFPDHNDLDPIPVNPTVDVDIFNNISSQASHLVISSPDTGTHFIIHAGFDENGKPLVADQLRSLIQGTFAEKTPTEQNAAIESLLGEQLIIVQDGQEFSYTISSITPLTHETPSDGLARLSGLPPSTQTLDLIHHSNTNYPHLLSSLGIPISSNSLTFNFCGLTVDSDGQFNLTNLEFVVVAEPTDSVETQLVPDLGQYLAASFIMPSPDVTDPYIGAAYTGRETTAILSDYLTTHPELSTYFFNAYSDFLTQFLTDLGETRDLTDYLDEHLVGTGPAHDQNLRLLRGQSQGSHLFSWNGDHLDVIGIILNPQGMYDADQARLIVEEIVQAEQLRRSILPLVDYFMEIGYFENNHSDPAYKLATSNIRAFTEYWQQSYLGKYGTSSYEFTFNGESINPGDYHLVLATLNELADTNFTLNDMMFDANAIETLHRELREKGIEDPFSLFGIQRFPSLDIRSAKSPQLKPYTTN